MTPLLNAQMGLAIAIAAAGWWGLRRIEIKDRMAEVRSQSMGLAWQIAAIVGGVFLLIGLSFEVDRGVALFAQAREAIAWAEDHMRQLLFTLLWAFGSAGFGLLAMMFRREWAGAKPGETPLLLRFAWGVLAACAIKWLLIDTLLYTFALDRAQVLGLYPLGNVQMLAAVVLSGIAMFLIYVSAGLRATDAAGERSAWAVLRAFAAIGACVVLLWGLTFEVDRLLGRMALDPELTFAWTPEQVRAFWWSVLWAAGGLLMMPLGRWRGVRELSAAGWVVIILSGALWLVFGAMIWRLQAPPVAATVLLNMHFLTGITVLGLLAASVRLGHLVHDEMRKNLTTLALGLITILGFALGSLEIDRGWMDNLMAKQMGLSIYWALYGAILVLVGFVRLSSPSRYLGLALLFITIVKILAIDMATVDQVWRVLSLIVSGLLLIATSMAYAKLSPKLLATLASRAQASA